MNNEKKFEFYWRGEFKNRDIYTKKFDKELDGELEFFQEKGLSELCQILNTFKEWKLSYENSNNNNYNNNYLPNLKKAINTVSLIYSEANSITKYKILQEAIIDGLITSNSPLRKKLLPCNSTEKNTPLVDDVHIGFYYNFKLKDYIEPDMLSNYKKEIDSALIQTQENNHNLKVLEEDFSQKALDNIQNSAEELKSKIDFFKNVLDNISSEYASVMLNLEDQYQRKLQFDKPSEFWNNKSNDYKIVSKKWLISSAIVTIILIVVTIFISALIFDINWDGNLIVIEMIGFSKNLTFGNILLITAIESIIIYILKTCIKYYDYNLKLYEFYKSKAMLSSFYVTIKDDDLTDDIKEKIYTQLFASSNVDFDKVEDTVLSKLR